MFKSAVAKETEVEKHERLKRERTETIALLNRLADEKRPEVEARQPQLLAMAEAAHNEDVESYSFECSRSGDFLSVTITRGYSTSVLGRKPVAKSTTLNLGATREFVLTEGHAPDREGSFRMECNVVSKKRAEGSRVTYYVSSNGHDEYAPRAAQEGAEWVCSAPYLSQSQDRPHYRVESKDTYYGGHDFYNSDREYYPKFEGHVRNAKDDTIKFRGICITIHAPAGLGRVVHEKILAALR